SLQIEGQARLRVDQLAALIEGRPQRDLLEGPWISAGKRVGQRGVGGEVHFADLVVGQSFGEIGDLVWIGLLVAIGPLPRNCNPALLERSSFANLEGLFMTVRARLGRIFLRPRHGSAEQGLVAEGARRDGRRARCTDAAKKLPPVRSTRIIHGWDPLWRRARLCEAQRLCTDERAMGERAFHPRQNGQASDSAATN